jgi:conjugative element/phage-associated large polyvalent protein/DNA primase RepB-like protein
VSPRTAQPIDRGTSHWRTYAQERARHQEERTARRDRSRDHRADEWRRLADRQRRERADLFKGSWRGRGDLLNAFRSQLAAQQARDKADLRDQQKLERARLQQQELARFPDFKEWLAQKDQELAQKWRYRERRPPTLEGPTFELPAPRDIRAFEAVADRGIVHYRMIGRRGPPAFTDRGKVIEIGDSRRREAVLAALQLCAQKWGTFTVHGNDQFRWLCAELAVEHGSKIANPELEHVIAAGRDRRRVELDRAPSRIRTPRSPADLYRVHFADITREKGAGKVDLSRIDTEIAVRLRLTGHQPHLVARAIREGARVLRPNEHRDWERYAHRAADFALSLSGVRLAQHLAPKREIFLRLEGRGLGRERE